MSTKVWDYYQLTIPDIYNLLLVHVHETFSYFSSLYDADTPQTSLLIRDPQLL